MFRYIRASFLITGIFFLVGAILTFFGVEGETRNTLPDSMNNEVLFLATIGFLLLLIYGVIGLLVNWLVSMNVHSLDVKKDRGEGEGWE
jgi:uncharacterized membrane protein